LCAVLKSLEGHLNEIAMTTEHLCDHQDHQIRLDKQADILREALQNPNHPLITMQDRWVHDTLTDITNIAQWVTIIQYSRAFPANKISLKISSVWQYWLGTRGVGHDVVTCITA